MAFPRTKKEQKSLCMMLRDLGSGHAETEADELATLRFHPVAEHVRAFAPDVTLVVGERGVGKTALFRTVFDNSSLSMLVRFAHHPRLPSGSPAWVQAYPLDRFPDGPGLRRCLDGQGPERASQLWFAYLIRALRSVLDGHCPEAVCRIWEPPGARPMEVLAAFDAAGDEPLVTLDALDERLEAEDRWIFAGYDELDVLGGYDWQAMRQGLLGLTGFWAAYSRRWRRLRSKIFLRTDLFRRHTSFGGADLAKLSANRVELTWNDRNLLAMLIKRIANTHQDLLRYCRDAKISFVPDSDLGHVPDLDSDETARPLVEKMLGLFMGANVKKGRTFTWILDHLRDARGHVAPRNLVRLFEHAARKEQANHKVRPPKLLHPTALRQALEDVSGDHVRQGMSHEWPWLHGLQERMHQQLMNMERGELKDLLGADWDSGWGGAGSSIRPPVDTPAEMIDYLLELGVFRERTKNRIDVPDIYLFGLGLKRKGGVARR